MYLVRSVVGSLFLARAIQTMKRVFVASRRASEETADGTACVLCPVILLRAALDRGLSRLRP